MEVSPRAFREVEFRAKTRGYHTEDVDQFLEQMAVGVEALQVQLREATERADRAEQAAAAASASPDAVTSEETLRRTLVLAQRTADQAVEEAREQARRIVAEADQQATALVAEAQQQARALVAEAEERARRTSNDTLADVRAELARLETVRAQSQQEIDVLRRWADEHRAHVVAALHDALAMVQRADVPSPSPTSTPIESTRPSDPSVATGRSGEAVEAGPEPATDAVTTVSGAPPDPSGGDDGAAAEGGDQPPGETAEAGSVAHGSAVTDDAWGQPAGEGAPIAEAVPSLPEAAGSGADGDPDDEALNQFFSAPEPTEERPSRLRRRR